jgi:hypothetical protein
MLNSDQILIFCHAILVQLMREIFEAVENEVAMMKHQNLEQLSFVSRLNFLLNIQ